MWRYLGLFLLLVFVVSLFPRSSPPIIKRFTVEVATPQGVRSGSSVISQQFTSKPWWFPADGSGSIRIRGEAVAVDLGGGKILFVPLEPVSSIRRTSNATGSSLSSLFRRDRVSPDGRVLGDELRYLNMLTFQNINDPSSAQQVDPLNLSAAFGPGYNLLSVRVEDSSDPVTLPNTKRFKALFDQLPEGYAFTQRL